MGENYVNGALDSIRNVVNAPNIADAFYEICKNAPNAITFSQAIAVSNDINSNTHRRKKTSKNHEVESRVNKIAAFLLAAGVKTGSKVAIISNSRPEWMEADIAILACAAVSVSIFQSLPVDDIGYILFDSEADVLFIENQEQLTKIEQLLEQEINIPATSDRAATKTKIQIKTMISFEATTGHALLTELSTILAVEEKQRPEESKNARLDLLAALVYTSGTTGPPKGVMQTHGNHLANVRQAYESSLLNQDSTFYLLLPLAHSFAKLIGYLGFLTPAKICFSAIVDSKSSKLDPRSAAKDMRESGATIFPVVPRLLEKMQDGIISAGNQTGLKGKLIRLTIDNSKLVFQSKKNGISVGVINALVFRATKGLRKKICSQLFGPNFLYALSGGAKLSVPVSEFFYGLEISILEGYGLTETCVATNVGRLNKSPIGSVGPVLASDIELKIAEDREILFRGPNIAVGYYHRPTDTSKTWDSENWFHTGDLGSLDKDNNLSIVGRKKEIIVTSGGKNIAPHDIEVAIKSHELISQVVLLGDGRKYCVAVVTLNPEQISQWSKARGISDLKAINTNKELRETIQQHISSINKDLASYETVKDFFIAPEDFTVDNGILTPTFKIKRSFVEKKYQEEIEKMYPARE